MLLFLSFDKETAPAELPFEVMNEKGGKALSKEGFQEMFAYINVENTFRKGNSTTNYLLSDGLFTKIDSDEAFRNKLFRYFFSHYVGSKHGMALYKNGGQYVYMLLGEKETKAVKNEEGRYICAAMFVKNLFIGFEEAVITERGLEVLPTGHYEMGMPVGGYLSFVIVTLAYVEGLGELPIYKSDAVKEKIYLLG